MGETVRRKAFANGELPELLRLREAGRTFRTPAVLDRLEARRLHRSGCGDNDDRNQAVFGHCRSTPTAPQSVERNCARQALQCDVPFHSEGR